MHHLQARRRPIALTEDDVLIIAGDFGLLWWPDELPSYRDIENCLDNIAAHNINK